MKKSDINPLPRFFDTYIQKVEEEELVSSLQRNLTVLETLDLQLLESLGDRVYAPGKWTVKDIFQHMIDTERIQVYRAMRIARNDKTVLPGFDENLFAANTNLKRITLQELIEEFMVLRKSSILMFKGFDAERLQRTGICFQVEISVLALGFVLSGHQIHHLQVIGDRYLPLLEQK